MTHRLARLLVLSVIGLLVSMLGGACHRAQTNSGGNNGGVSESTPKNTPGASDNKGAGAAVNPDQTAAPEGAMIMWSEGDVTLRRQGAAAFAPIVDKDWFNSGDTLQIGNTSFAHVLCTDRGVCALGVGTYTTCCTPSCALEAPMMRRIGAPDTGLIVKKSELSPADAKMLNESETKIRSLGLGQVTTQFLITNLYSNWKLEEANQQLDILSNQLSRPEAKQELKQLYSPITQKTGDMHLRFNRVDDAKKLYLMNLTSSSQTNNLKETAAAHAGLAQAFKQSGDTDQAVQHFEVAKDIYVKQGETRAAATTEKQIVETKATKRFDRATLPRSRSHHKNSGSR